MMHCSHMYDDLIMHVQMYVFFHLSEIVSGETTSPMRFKKSFIGN